MSERKPDKSCEEFAELISAYFDDRLSETQAKAVESHLASCPACARRLEDYKLLRNLMNADLRENPIDLNSAVMANLEREQLLEGLELVTKPPVSRLVKLMRAVSVAAMLGLIVGTVVLVMHFNTNNSHPTPATMEIAHKPMAEPKSETETPPAELPAIAKVRTQSTPKADTTDSQLAVGPIWSEDRSDVKSIKVVETSKSTAVMTLAKRNAVPLPETTQESIQPNQPLTLRPTTTAEVKSQPRVKMNEGFDLAWPIPLVYRLSTSDVPTRMLLKEQILIIMKENDVPAIYEPFRVGQALDEGREFFYVAKKGLDLPPGSASSQILLVTTPEKFSWIYSLLQFAVSEGVSQLLPADLEAFTQSQVISASLADMAGRSNDMLKRAFGSGDVLETLPTMPATTSMAIRAMHPASLVTSSRFAPATQPMATQTAPATQPTIELKTLPVLIVIDIKTTPATSMPATAPTSQPVTRPATQPVDDMN
jgi:hypothetical protein